MADRPVLFRRRGAPVHRQIEAVLAALALFGCTTYGEWLRGAGQDAGGAPAVLTGGGGDGSAELPPVSGGSAEAGAVETGGAAAGGSDPSGAVAGSATAGGSADGPSGDAGDSGAGSIATGGTAGISGSATGGVGGAGEAGNTSGGAGASSAGSGNAGSAGAPATRELARHKPVTASTQQAGHPPEYGNDNDTSTAWCAVNQSFPQWWRVDLGAVYALSSFSSTWGTADRTYSYTIETSTDGSVWLSRATISGVGIVQSGVFPPATSGRYVRVTVTYATSPSWACFAEFSFIGK